MGELEHSWHVVYDGPIAELQGETFLARKVEGSTESIRVQADDVNLKYKNQRLGGHWHCFPAAHFKTL